MPSAEDTEATEQFEEGDKVRVKGGVEEGNVGVVIEVRGPYVRFDLGTAYHHTPDKLWCKKDGLELVDDD